MPAVAPLPPSTIRELLEKRGYKLIGMDEYNWAFASRDDEEPIFVPHAVDRVPLEIAFHVAQKVGFGEYFDAFNTANFDQPFPQAPADPQ